MSKDYRHYAAQCLELARAADDASARAHLLHLAEQWRSMAEKIEKIKSPVEKRDVAYQPD
jgi:hypothetical protein